MKKMILALFLVSLVQITLAQDSTSRKINDLLTAYNSLGKFNGSALVAWKGKVIFEKGYGFKNAETSTLDDPKTIYQIASVTKQFTSTVILKLVESGKMSLSDPLSKYYPDFPHGESITIENLLTHTSGIYDYTHEDTVTHLDSEQKMMAFLRQKVSDFAPGTDWSYSNSGYSILGFIIQKVSKLSYEKAVRKFIFQPLGMKHSGFDFERLQHPDKAIGYSLLNDSMKTPAGFSDSAVVFAAGAIYSTVEDLYKWHLGLQGYKIVSKKLMDKAYTPFKNNYGYGWIIDTVAGQRMLYHSGGISGFASNFARVTRDNLCIALLSNKEGVGLETITREIMAILYHQAYKLPAKRVEIALSNDILQKYTGSYQLENPDMIIEISIENGRLLAHAVNGPTFPLTAEKENLFFTPDGQAEIEFVPDETGKTDHLFLRQNDKANPGKKIK